MTARAPNSPHRIRPHAVGRDDPIPPQNCAPTSPQRPFQNLLSERLPCKGSCRRSRLRGSNAFRFAERFRIFCCKNLSVTAVGRATSPFRGGFAALRRRKHAVGRDDPIPPCQPIAPQRKQKTCHPEPAEGSADCGAPIKLRSNQYTCHPELAEGSADCGKLPRGSAPPSTRPDPSTRSARSG